MTSKTKSILSIILAIANGVATVAAIATTTIQAPKAKDKIDQVKNNNPDDKITFMDKVKVVGPTMALPYSLAAIALIAGGASTILSKKVELSLGASIVALQQGYQKYSSKVKETIGKAKNNEIVKSIADSTAVKPVNKDITDRTLYYMDNIGYFWAKPEMVQKAVLHMHEMIYCDRKIEQYDFFYKLSDFLYDCDAIICDSNFTMSMAAEWGWTLDYLSDYSEHDIWNSLNEDSKERVCNKGKEIGTPYIFLWWEVDPVVVGWSHGVDCYNPDIK